MGSDGAIQPGEGMALVSEDVIALRLNVSINGTEILFI
jgi:hypothetical protein